MPFAQLRVRLPDRPGVLASVTEAVATIRGDIVNVDVQHVHDGHALDVLSIHLPAGVGLDTLTAAVTHARRRSQLAWLSAAGADSATTRIGAMCSRAATSWQAAVGAHKS